MAVIVSDNTNASYDGNLSTANGFYRVEAYNLGFLSSTYLATNTVRYITPTFANAGNCQGIMLGCLSELYDTTTANTTVTLEEAKTMTMATGTPGVITSTGHGLLANQAIEFSTTGTLLTGITAGTVYYVKTVLTADTFTISATAGGTVINLSGSQSGTHTLWVQRATTSYSANDILKADTRYGRSSTVFVPFTGGTFPYAVDTTVGKWKFRIAGVSQLCILTSNGTSPCYATWCDNKVSFNNDDVLIIKNAIDIDTSFSTGAVTSTGDTVYGISCIVCRSDDGLTPMLTCLTPASSYTWTVKGCIGIGARSLIQIGTESAPIPYAQQFIMDFVAAAAGTAVPAIRQNTLHGSHGDLIMYGEVPTVRKATLSQDENTGQAVIHTNETTGWEIGDSLGIGRSYNKGAGDTTVYTIQSISDKTITLTGNLATYNRKINGQVLRKGHYGIIMRNLITSVGMTIPRPSRFILSGVQTENIWFDLALSYSYNDDATYTEQVLIQDCLVWNTISSNYAIINSLGPNQYGFLMNRVYGWRASAMKNVVSAYTTRIYSGKVYESNCVWLNCTASFTNSSLAKLDVQNNVVENVNDIYPAMMITGYDPVFKNNTVWGHSYPYTGGFEFNYMVDSGSGVSEISGNTVDYSTNGVALGSLNAAYSVKGKMKNCNFGQVAANTYDIYLGSGFFDVEFDSCLLNFTSGSIVNLPYLTPGTKIRFSEYNETSGDNRVYTPYGYLQSSGTGLTDTTCRTAGGYALRMQPTSSSNRLEWRFTIPTGNIQNKTMMVGIWCKINSATYYSGTHQLPRLTIDYDNGTTAYVQAGEGTDWQFLPLPFTPTTTYGQITVTVSTMTDATSTEAYVYFDDFKTLYPAESPLNTQAMDLWANGLPVTPPLATVLSANDVWSASSTTDYGDATMGELSKTTEHKVDDNSALIMSK